MSVSTVHVVFKTHLDIGFTDFAAEVVRQYREKFLPAALSVARELRQRGGDRFIWTTGSWLIDHAFEHGDAALKKALEEGIAAGDVRWHALPFTMHTELLDVDLVRHALTLSQRLDRRFAVKTVAAKMTDVPGHTRGLVPILADAGVTFLHIGVNPASRAPQVPDCFRWKVGAAEIVVGYDKSGYGSALQVPGLDHVLAFAHTGDNQGPQGPDQILAEFARVRSSFTGAEVRAGTLDDFARAVDGVRASLPVIEQEIGDTWIHGTGTDPYKTARLRALIRLRQRWLVEGATHDDPAAFARFSDGLIMVAEHTWGLDVKTHLAEFENWERDQLAAVRKKPNYLKMEASWTEQREIIDEAVAALPTELRREARAVARDVLPDAFDTRGFREIDPRQELRLPRFQLRIDHDTGAISRLRRNADRREWATQKAPLGLVRYQTFDQADYERFKKQYLVRLDQHAGWAIPDFLKPGIERARPISALWLAKLEHASWRSDDAADLILLVLSLPDEARKRFGAPKRVTMLVTVPKDDDHVDLELHWHGKPASRLPEAMWVTFCPAGVGDEGWTLDKLGQDISPMDVVAGGNRRLHGVGTGAKWRGEDGKFDLETLDAHLIAPGVPGLLEAHDRPPQCRHGMHVNLYNNVWGTNFPMWYDEDARFRFTLRFA